MEKDNEEEKKAIAHLEWLLDDGILASEDEPYIEIILNLIEKQQKEIEELKEENAEHIEVITEWVNGERINDIKHISKDKIRKKINYYEERGYIEIAGAFKLLLEEN